MILIDDVLFYKIREQYCITFHVDLQMHNPT